MELFHPPFFDYLLICALGLIIIYLSGHITIGLFLNSQNKYASFFQKLFAGFVLIITLFACIWTSGNTIFLLTILLAVIFFLEKTHFQKESISIKTSQIKNIELHQLIGSVVFLCSFYTLSYYVFFYNGTGNIWCDYPVYAIFSHNIEVTHIEGASVFAETVITDKYHYTDIWLNVIFSYFSGKNNLYVYLLVVIPLITTLVFHGGVAIVQSSGLKDFLASLILGILILFVKPFTVNTNDFYFAVIDYPKLGSIYLFVIAATVFYLQKKYLLGGLVLLLLIAFYTPVAPGIVGGLIGLTIFVGHYNKMNLVNRYTLYILLSIGFYVIFYYVINEGTISHNSNPNKSLNWAFMYVIKMTIVYFGSFSLSVILFMGLAKLLKLQIIPSLLNNKSAITVFGFIIFGLFSSFIAGGLYSIISIEGGQILKSFAVPLLSVFFFLLVIFILKKIPLFYTRVFSILLLVLYIANATYNNSVFFLGSEDEDWEQINTESYSEINNLLGNDTRAYSYVRNYSEENIHFQHMYRILSFPPMNKIVHFNGYYNPYCLSVFDIPSDISPEYNDRHLSLFYRYVEAQKEKNEFISVSHSQREFISKHDVGFIVVENGAQMPFGLTDNIEAFYVDNRNNTLYVLKKYK